MDNWVECATVKDLLRGMLEDEEDFEKEETDENEEEVRTAGEKAQRTNLPL